MDDDQDVQNALKPVFLYRVDAEKGEGVDLAGEFNVKAYPTFILTDSNGETIDRWLGYAKGYLLETMDLVMADLSTIKEKQARYDSKPNSADASVLGRYNYALGNYKESVEYYKTAQNLDSNGNYAMNIFTGTLRGFGKDSFTSDDVIAAADNVKDSKTADPDQVANMALSMVGWASRNDKIDIVGPYIEAGLKAISAKDEYMSDGSYNELMVSKSLYVTHDNEAAVRYKKAGMGEGWKDDAGQLNAFAWWCFENKINLEEAEQLARKGVEIADPGKQKAMILDTLAEICGVLDNCSESVQLIKMAMKEDPESNYYPKQLTKFEEMLAAQN